MIKIPTCQHRIVAERGLLLLLLLLLLLPAQTGKIADWSTVKKNKHVSNTKKENTVSRPCRERPPPPTKHTPG